MVASVWISAGVNSNLENDYGTSTWSFNPSNMPLLIQNLHGHIFVMVFMFIDFAVNMIPMNIVHLLYLWMFGWIYALATFIVYTIDESRDEVYPILNWKYGHELTSIHNLLTKVVVVVANHVYIERPTHYSETAYAFFQLL